MMINKKTVPLFILSLSIISLFSCASSKSSKEKKDISVSEPEEIVVEEVEVPISMEPVFKSDSSDLLSVPETHSYILENFEDLNYWYAVGNSWDTETFHNLSLSAVISDEWSSKGTKSLKCTLEEATKENSCQASFACNSFTKSDFSKFKWLGLTIYNPNRWDYEINMAFSGGKKLQWNETESIILKPGVTHCIFDISKIEMNILKKIDCLVIQTINENPGNFFYIDEITLYE